MTALVEGTGWTIDQHLQEGEDHAVLVWLPVPRPRHRARIVGLTAAFSAALGAVGISCNVLAGFYYDHMLVPVPRHEAAVAVLRELVGAQA